MKRAIVIVAALVVLSGAASSTPTQYDRQQDARISALASQVATLQTQVNGLNQAAPAPTTTPTPPPASWFGLADPWAGIPFGSLPDAPAGQMWISGDQGGRTIGGFTFRNRPAGVNVIVLDNARNLTLDLIDFDTVPEAIYMVGCSDITISRIRARNIFGPFTRTLFHSGNLIQATNCSRVTVHDAKLDQPDTIPAGYDSTWGTEDIVSLGGNAGAWSDWTIERTCFDGGAWQSWSGTAFLVGDGDSGRNVTVRDSLLVDPGQVGIGTGNAGPYAFANIDIAQSRGNQSMQVRTTNDTVTNVRANLPASGATPWPTTFDYAAMRKACAL